MDCGTARNSPSVTWSSVPTRRRAFKRDRGGALPRDRTPGPRENQYERHGTCIYQAALIVGTGEIVGHCVASNSRANFETLVETVMAQPICRRADRVIWIIVTVVPTTPTRSSGG